MNFRIGDNIDSNHCIALKHEFLRCRDSFEEFKFFATAMISGSKSNWLSYKMYNAYADFILHLYAFMEGCLARETETTKVKDRKDTKAYKVTENYINSHVYRILTYKRTDILKGRAESWENDISYYSEEVPNDFASDFRNYRNNINGHVSHERTEKLIVNNTEINNKKAKYFTSGVKCLLTGLIVAVFTYILFSFMI